jgi:hypothetical protein
MSDKVIEIRSNITSSVIRFEALEEERKKREEEERKERWAREEAERKRIREEWAAKHPNMEKYTYCSAYNFETFNYEYGGYCKIHFYEWSDINSCPLKFNKYGWFYKFLDESGLWIQGDVNVRMKSFPHTFITCKPGSKDLIVCNSYEELKREFHLAENTAKVLAVVPEI